MLLKYCFLLYNHRFGFLGKICTFKNFAEKIYNIYSTSTFYNLHLEDVTLCFVFSLHLFESYISNFP